MNERNKREEYRRNRHLYPLLPLLLGHTFELDCTWLGRSFFHVSHVEDHYLSLTSPTAHISMITGSEWSPSLVRSAGHGIPELDLRPTLERLYEAHIQRPLLAVLSRDLVGYLGRAT